MSKLFATPEQGRFALLSARDGVMVVQPAGRTGKAPQTPGDACRSPVTEATGPRGTRAMRPGMALGGAVPGPRIVVRNPGEVGDDGRSGVAPITEMSRFTLGSGEA